MTLIGGHSAAGTPAPHGAAWFSSTQLSAASAPMMNRPAPVERETSLAPGAAPWSCLPPLRVTGLPATMPLTWVPWPPTRQRVGVDRGRQRLHRAERLERVAQRLEVGDHGAAAVRLREVGVGGVDARVDDRDADAVAGQLRARPPRSGSGWPRSHGSRRCWCPGRARCPGCPRRRSRRARCAPPGSALPVPVATTTPILSKLVTAVMPVAATASLACCSVAPCTITAVGAPASRRDSWVARWDDTLARSPDSAAVAVVGATRLAEVASAAAPTARVVLIRTIASLHAPSRRCGGPGSAGSRGDVRSTSPPRPGHARYRSARSAA